MRTLTFKLVSLFVVLFIAFSPLLAQDVITLRSGDEIKAIVKEVGIKDVRYVKFSNPSGPVMVIPKTEIFMIKYKNGTKEVFKKPETPVAPAPAAAPSPKPVPSVEPVKQVSSGQAAPRQSGKSTEGHFQLRVQGIAGGTLGDLKEYLWDVEGLQDWNQFTYGGDAQVSFRLGGNFWAGAEFAMHRLYYWQSRYYNGWSYSYDHRNKWRYHLGPFFEFSDDTFYTQVGVNMDLDNEVVCLTLAPGIKIRLGDHLSIPFGVRADWMLESHGLGTYAGTLGILYH